MEATIVKLSWEQRTDGSRNKKCFAYFVNEATAEKYEEMLSLNCCVSFKMERVPRTIIGKA